MSRLIGKLEMDMHTDEALFAEQIACSLAEFVVANVRAANTFTSCPLVVLRTVQALKDSGKMFGLQKVALEFADSTN